MAGGVVVFGWYALRVTDAALRNTVTALLEAKDYIGALNAAPSGSLVPSNVLRERQGEGRLQAATIIGPLRIPAKDTPEVTRAFTAGLDVTDPPLVLAEL
jgi:hypothetical protein